MEIQNALNVGEETYEIEIPDWLSEKEGLPKTLRIKIIRESDRGLVVEQILDNGESTTAIYLRNRATK